MSISDTLHAEKDRKIHELQEDIDREVAVRDVYAEKLAVAGTALFELSAESESLAQAHAKAALEQARAWKREGVSAVVRAFQEMAVMQALWAWRRKIIARRSVARRIRAIALAVRTRAFHCWLYIVAQEKG
jgi:ribonuclease D